jgi:excisionase family DNA binding protein
MKDLLTTRESAEILGISDARIRQLIYAGKLPSQKIGQMNLVKKADLELIRERKTGRPPKVENGNQTNERKFKTIFDIVPELAGKHDNLPSDLSTNKKYLEGLGRD